MPEPHIAVSRGVLNELARGFLLHLKSEDREAAARFASQLLTEQSGAEHPDRTLVRPRTVRGPLPRGSLDGRTLEPPP
ncbi:MAG TPA: hypothetical protein VGV89_08480 [Thermoplasmata archaeon]|nr:hypothetical protein [Thermoplasmata archaeon]